MNAPLTRRIEWRPAFDRRAKDPAKNYGIHGVEMRWLLIGPDGVVQFLVFTNWMLPHVRRELAAKCRTPHDVELFFSPMAADVGYHSLVPQYEGQSPMGKCDYLGGRECYYDGSGLQAEPLLELLIEKGDEAVWSEMERRYYGLFPPLLADGAR